MHAPTIAPRDAHIDENTLQQVNPTTPPPEGPVGISPRVDLVFQRIFGAPGSEPLLIDLLNSVLRPPRPIVEVRLLHPVLSPEQHEGRALIVDLVAIDDRGVRVQVERLAVSALLASKPLEAAITLLHNIRADPKERALYEAYCKQLSIEQTIKTTWPSCGPRRRWSGPGPSRPRRSGRAQSMRWRPSGRGRRLSRPGQSKRSLQPRPSGPSCARWARPSP